MRRLFAAMRRRPLVATIGVIALLAVLVGGAVAVTDYTSRPAFCTSCHEMSPYYAAWDAGAHAGISCVSCHVDPGIKAQVSHKVVALKEVYNHFTTKPTFPGAVTDVPDSRCLACHTGTIDPQIPGFVHETHRAGRSCVDCHSSVGHKVTSAALAEAGILNPATAQARERLTIAAVGAGAANVAGHVKVACSDCHDLAATGCANCHVKETRTHPALESVSTSATGGASSCTNCHTTAASWAFQHPAAASATCVNCHVTPAEHRPGVCTTCHTTGSTWTFEHPSSSATCTTCHTRPASHAAGACTTCHEPGAKWVFRHPASTSCATCHTRPAKHYSGTCSACHSPRVAFANTKFSHPSAKANCATCHAKPKGHYSGTCSSCHNPKVAFKNATFKHPGSTATCTNCHTRPSGHSTKTCVTCHRPGVSWKFYHPTSKTCSSCHSAPSNHYGTTCANCHSPAAAWSSATFSHPRIPGGEHTYRSFACTNCHANGYSSYSCLRCHDSNNPGD